MLKSILHRESMLRNILYRREHAKKFFNKIEHAQEHFEHAHTTRTCSYNIEVSKLKNILFKKGRS